MKEKNKRKSTFDSGKKKTKDDLIFNERKVKNNANVYRLPIDSSNLGWGGRVDWLKTSYGGGD